MAYGEDEKRGIVRLNLVSFAFTLAALLIGIGLNCICRNCTRRARRVAARPMDRDY